jgi:hypothetical protein
VDWGTLGVVAAMLFGAVGLQSFWVTRELDAIGSRLDRSDTRFDRIDTSLDRIETALLGVDRRVTRLEERL